MIPQSVLPEIISLNDKLNELAIVTEGTTDSGRILDEKTLDAFVKMQNIFSTNDFYDTSWQLDIAASKRSGTIAFPSMSEKDGTILRALVVEQLIKNGTIESGRRIVRDLIPFFAFLQDKNVKIEQCRSIVIDAFSTRLESDSTLTNGKRNDVMRAVTTLMEFCVTHQIIQGIGNIDCSKRYPMEKNVARAPDACVILQLDAIFFAEHLEMPNTYRCIYLILRLIPNRIGEVLEMGIDCISFPAPGCFSLDIPTYKETTYHTLEYNTYIRKIDGWCEGILFRSISKQKKFAIEKNLSGVDQGYLFVSPRKDRVVTITEFDTFLQELIEEHQILDESGKLAKVTSHSLRHVAIGERLRGGIITPIQTMLESNHKNLSQTMGYGYQSKHDEAMHLKQILQEIRKAPPENPEKDIKPQEMAERKYLQLRNQAYTRIIPGQGICCDTTCTPRFEECFLCPSFEPSPEYLEYFIASIDFLAEKVETLKRRHGDPKAIQYNQQQIDVLQSIVDKLRP